MLKAAKIMQKSFEKVSPGMSVRDLGRMFIQKNVTGAAVVDEGGSLLGVVTEDDLISQNKRFHLPTVLRIFDAFIPLDGFGAVEDEFRKMSAGTVDDICTREPLTITPETAVDEIATIMTEKRVHHLPVMDGGVLVGMVDQHDVLRGVAGEAAEPAG